MIYDVFDKFRQEKIYWNIDQSRKYKLRRVAWESDNKLMVSNKENNNYNNYKISLKYFVCSFFFEYFYDHHKLLIHN